MLSGVAFVEALRGRLGLAGCLSAFYGCLFIIYGVAMPYLNPWLASRGVTVSEIAIIASVTPLVRMLAGPVFGFLADRQHAHRTYLIWLCWASFAAWLALGQASTFWTILLAQILISITGAALMPLAETMAVAAVRSHSIDYGRVRSWGSMTFLAASLMCGWLVDWRGISVTIVVLIIAALMTTLSALLLPPLPAETTDRKPLRLADALLLVRQPVFLVFLAASGLAHSAHATLNVFSTLHWQTQGISNAWCGALWAIGIVAEIAVFWAAPKFARQIGPLHLLGAGLAAAVLRWTVMGFDPPLALLAPLQALHGLTYGAVHLGAIQFMAQAIPPSHSGTGQSVYTLVGGGLGAAIATQASGAAYLAYGGGAYWLMACLALVGLLALVALAQRWNGRVINVAE